MPRDMLSHFKSNHFVDKLDFSITNICLHFFNLVSCTPSLVFRVCLLCPQLFILIDYIGSTVVANSTH